MSRADDAHDGPPRDGPAPAPSHDDLPAGVSPGAFSVDLPTFPGGGAPLPPAAAPPPLRRAPATPPPRRAKPDRLNADSLFADSLPLPDLAPAERSRRLTLLGQEAGQLLNRAGAHPARRRWPFVALAGVATVALGTWLARDRLVAALVPKATPPPPTATEEARALYLQGLTAFDKKAYVPAIQAFEQALGKDPHLALVHRSLGIVYAVTQAQDKAVAHYRTYLEMAPEAADAVEVRKIVDDYAKAQAQAPPPPPAPASHPAAGGAPAPRGHRPGKGRRPGR